MSARESDPQHTRDHCSDVADDSRRFEENGERANGAERTVRAYKRVSEGCLMLTTFELTRLDGDRDCCSCMHCRDSMSNSQDVVVVKLGGCVRELGSSLWRSIEPTGFTPPSSCFLDS